MLSPPDLTCRLINSSLHNSALQPPTSQIWTDKKGSWGDSTVHDYRKPCKDGEMRLKTKAKTRTLVFCNCILPAWRDRRELQLLSFPPRLCLPKALTTFILTDHNRSKRGIISALKPKMSSIFNKLISAWADARTKHDLLRLSILRALRLEKKVWFSAWLLIGIGSFGRARGARIAGECSQNAVRVDSPYDERPVTPHASTSCIKRLSES